MGHSMNDNYPLSGVTMLLVEDDLLLAMDIEDTLAGMGAVVVDVCHTLDEAMARADVNDFAVAVLDFSLGSDSVAPLARRLARRNVLSPDIGDRNQKRAGASARAKARLALACASDLALDRRLRRIVELQELNELSASTTEATLDCADTHLAYNRSFLVRESTRADQRQHFPLLSREFSQSVTKIFEVEMAFLVARHSEAARVQAIAVLDLAGAFAIIGVVDIAEDGEQPRPQARPRLELL